MEDPDARETPDAKPTEQTEEQEEDQEYGLSGLVDLPLLEQVHRLFHAIQHKYPYQQVTSFIGGIMKTGWWLMVFAG